MRNHLPTWLFLLIAFACYFLGMALPAAVFILLGLLAEMVFWVRIIRGLRRKPNR
jgi:hypothetical protein